MTVRLSSLISAQPTAVSSGLENIASGIQVAATQPGGIAAIKDSYSSATEGLAEGWMDSQLNTIAPEASMELPQNYLSKLSRFESNSADAIAKAKLAEPATTYATGSPELVDPSVKVSAQALSKSLSDLTANQSLYGYGIAAFAAALQDMVRDPGAQGQLDNFDIQNFLSTFQQAEDLSASLKKKMDDQRGSILRKL